MKKREMLGNAGYWLLVTPVCRVRASADRAWKRRMRFAGNGAFTQRFHLIRRRVFT